MMGFVFVWRTASWLRLTLRTHNEWPGKSYSFG
jgi:hypothetical protein